MDDTQFTGEERAEFSLDITACAVAEAFTDAYYYALEKQRRNIGSFYCPKISTTESSIPFIAWNGEVFSDGAALQAKFEYLPHTHFDVEDLDCNILNPKYIPASDVKNGSGDDNKDMERRMSITLMVNGSVRLEEPLKGPLRSFCETFVLVPNPDKLPSPRPHFNTGWHQEWLIQTQNFKFLEWGASEVSDGTTAAKSEGAKMEVDRSKANGGTRNGFQGRNKGIASQFAAAGLLIKGKGKS